MKAMIRYALGIAAALIIVLAGAERSLSLPSLPGLPTVPDVKHAAKGVVSNELLKQFGTWFNSNRPVYVSGNDVLPTVASLPGGAFHPASLATIQTLFKQSRSPIVHLPAGDYNISVVTYCMGHNNQGPWRNKFLLAPIRGAWSDILVALNYRAFGSSYSAPQIQGLSWAMQAGMNYAEMNPGSQQIVDDLLPDFKQRMQGDFYDRARDEWNSIASKVPNAPSFDSALGQLGDVGKAIADLRQARDQIIADGNNFNAMVAQFAHLGIGRVADQITVTPWSIIAPGVYARLRTNGSLLTPGVVQMRVTTGAASHGYQVASIQLRGLGKPVAFNFGLPFTNWAGFLNSGTQPLSWTPQPGSAPDPNQSDGGADNHMVTLSAPINRGNQIIIISSSWKRQSANGQDNGNNNGGQNDISNGGTSSTGSPGNSQVTEPSKLTMPTNNVNPVTQKPVITSPCDPPGNTFGVQNGAVLSTGATSLTLGKGSGNGTVCLLLRPYVDLNALGWSGRGTGTVKWGNVSYNLPGKVQTGHLVVYARYQYGLIIIHPHNPSQQDQSVTAVIDFSGVGPFCPQLAQTMGKPPMFFPYNGPNWLSDASLENRLCITAMQGPQIQVHAWVVDGSIVGPSSLTHPVDPQNFLYSDYWGHM